MRSGDHKFLIMQTPPVYCYLIHLRPLHHLHQPILKHAQPMFLPECDRPSSSPTQTTGI